MLLRVRICFALIIVKSGENPHFDFIYYPNTTPVNTATEPELDPAVVGYLLGSPSGGTV